MSFYVEMSALWYVILYFQSSCTSMPGTPVDCNMELSPEFVKERESCMQYFGCWSEAEQVHFVKSLLSGMCHYQHGQVDLFLKPMLQRDFISALPGNRALRKSVQYLFFQEIWLSPKYWRWVLYPLCRQSLFSINCLPRICSVMLSGIVYFILWFRTCVWDLI